MDSGTFVDRLLKNNQAILDKLHSTETLQPNFKTDPTIGQLLKLALKNEQEAFEIAAIWIPITQEIDMKLALARQAGDEAKHYRLIQFRLAELGFLDTDCVPVSPNQSPIFEYLVSLTSTVERIAAGQFTREHIAIIKNNQFIRYCRALGDNITADLYENIINRDEYFHHRQGQEMLTKYATSSTLQNLSGIAATNVLILAEETQRIMAQRSGFVSGPGC